MDRDEQMLTLHTEERSGAVVVTVGGEIDALTAPRLKTALVRATSPDRPLVLDLTDVTFLGSPGLRTLLEAATDASPLRVVVDHSRPVTRPLEITGLDAVLMLYETVEDALHA